MKKVFRTSDEVIHLFAQRSQEEARCPNVFFEGDTIYSYGRHYELARFLDDETILINDSGYSVTTSKQISEVRYATRQYRQFFEMETDVRKVHSQVMDAKDKLARARKPEMYISEILRLWEKMNEFHEWRRKNAKLGKRNYYPYSTDQYKEVKRLVSAIEKGATGLKEKLADHARKEAARKRKEEKKLLKEAITNFLAYEIRTFRIGDEDYLRLSKCKEYVETSQGVRVSVKAAKILYQMILAGKDVKGYKIDGYTVTSVNSTLKIGCHNINMESVHNIGKLL